MQHLMSQSSYIQEQGICLLELARLYMKIGQNNDLSGRGHPSLLTVEKIRLGKFFGGVSPV